jgi:RNA polymerase sigma-70 factor (ECF subfamily)
MRTFVELIPMSDRSALAPDTWLDQHGDALYRFAYGRVNDPDLAADLVQETFLEGLRARSSFAGNSSVRTWLTSILKFKIIDCYRRSARTPRVEEEPAVEPFFDRRGHWKAAPLPWDDDPGATLERSEFWDVLGQCITKLPEHLADAFLAIEVGELGRDHVCERFRITPANLSARLYRARLLLRHCLENHWFAEKVPRIRDRLARSSSQTADSSP